MPLPTCESTDSATAAASEALPQAQAGAAMPDSTAHTGSDRTALHTGAAIRTLPSAFGLTHRSPSVPAAYELRLPHS